MKALLSLVISLFVYFTLSGCAVRSDAFDVDLLNLVQTSDYQQVSYTVRIVGNGICDMTGVEVEVTFNFFDPSDGQNVTKNHYIGRVGKDKRKRVEFEFQTFGKRVDIDSFDVEIDDYDDLENCSFFNL